MNYLDALGWVGSICIVLFYWLLGSQRIGWAYLFSTIGAVFWLWIGIEITLLEASPGHLPSLIFVELAVIIMNIRGIIKWRQKQIVDRS